MYSHYNENILWQKRNSFTFYIRLSSFLCFTKIESQNSLSLSLSLSFFLSTDIISQIPTMKMCEYEFRRECPNFTIIERLTGS